MPKSTKQGQTLSSDILDAITLKMSSSLDLSEVLETITEGLVQDLGAAFARIWLLGPGDLCNECFKADACEDRARCLHLAASAGIYTNLDGEYRRVPLGALKIGRIAQGGGRLTTNDVLNDPRLPNKEWLKDNALVSFAGYPLSFRDQLLGVLGMFSQRKMSEAEFDHVRGFASQAAIAIKNAQLFAEVEGLKNRLHAENVYMREEIDATHFQDILGRSDSLKKALTDVAHVAPTDASVLILGETGTGKELFARAVHQGSHRKKRPLVKVNCAAIPSGLIESEMFGHEKGAFTGALARRQGRFELANGGTIFLDEIGDLPLDLQGKLLRVLQEHEFERLGGTRTMKTDARVIAATNRDLKKAVDEGRFRSDLYYRLNVFPVVLPTLAERREDIPELAQTFAHKFAKQFGRRVDAISGQAMRELEGYHWPGNIRELEHVIERAVIVHREGELELHGALAGVSIPPAQGHDAEGGSAGGPPESPSAETPGTLATLDSVQRMHIRSVLEHTGWRVSGRDGAAERLGLKPTTLESKMKKLGISRDEGAS